jgi:hypothetical protein
VTQDVEEAICVYDLLGSAPYQINHDYIGRGRDKKWVAICPISYDFFGDYVITVNSMLHQSSRWLPEFKFGLAKNYIGNNRPPEMLMTSVAARPYIPEGRRSDVVDVVVQSLEELIGRVRPPEVLRQLKEPEKPSLRVHHRISDTFACYGYTVEYRWPEKRTYQWVHVRLT